MTVQSSSHCVAIDGLHLDNVLEKCLPNWPSTYRFMLNNGRPTSALFIELRCNMLPVHLAVCFHVMSNSICWYGKKHAAENTVKNVDISQWGKTCRVGTPPWHYYLACMTHGPTLYNMYTWSSFVFVDAWRMFLEWHAVAKWGISFSFPFLYKQVSTTSNE